MFAILSDIHSNIEALTTVLADIEKKCTGGEILCGECKQILAPLVEEFLEEHQAAREEVKDRLHEFSANRLREDLLR